MIKLFISDIDGTLTDSTTYYSKNGEELKQFSHRDGRGFYLIKEFTSCKTILITSEIGGINKSRADKFIKLKTIEKYIEGENDKLSIIKKLLKEYKINLNECIFIGDDTNDLSAMIEIVNNGGLIACPIDAHKDIKNIDNIYISRFGGGHGAIRNIIDYLFEKDLFYKE